MKVLFIGLGHMGSGMAMRLINSKKFDVTVYNRTKDKAEEHLKAGANLAESIFEASKNTDVVITMLSDDKALSDVSKEILISLPENSIHLSMSTISVKLARELEISHREKGQIFIGAPVFGRPYVAAEGKLTIIAGGNEKHLEKCRPLFEEMSQKVLPVGESPAHAHLTKILGNFMLLSSIEMLAEALRIAEHSGMKQENFLEAMTSSLFTAPFIKNYGNMMIEESYKSATAFTLTLARKDAHLAMEAADEIKQSMPMAQFIHSRIHEAVEQGMGNSDLSALKALQ